GHPCRPAIGSHHQGPKRTCTSKSLLDHHSQTDGACAPRAMPGAHTKKGEVSPALTAKFPVIGHVIRWLDRPHGGSPKNKGVTLNVAPLFYPHF
ncbi:MAG TPA: hypothetical protein VGJ93_01830, partial [Desulfuromonadaceae bacterium]